MVGSDRSTGDSGTYHCWPCCWCWVARPRRPTTRWEDLLGTPPACTLPNPPYVRNSPTFQFDGIEDTFKLESVREIQFCPGCYEYTFYFESRHPGVGDRTGVQPLRDIITPHRAVINLTYETNVVMGVLDESWDIGRQLIIDRE